VNALKAFALLRDEGSLPLLEKVAREDPNLRVRDAARRAVEATRGRAAMMRGHEDAAARLGQAFTVTSFHRWRSEVKT
jgi:hypothetical protein